jgi:plastocyanin
MHRRHALGILAALPLAAFAVPVRAATSHAVTIKSFKFNPAVLEVAVGDTIVFTNQDGAPHTATASDGSWDTGRLGKGKSAEIAVTSGMSGAYICKFHPMMAGQIKVAG